MAVIAEFTIGQDQFPLGAALAEATDVDVELDRILPGGGSGVPYVWATGGDFEQIERVVERSTVIDALVPIERSDDAALYRIEWGRDAASLLQRLVSMNVTLLRAYRDGPRWVFRLRFEDHDDLAEFHSFFSAQDVTYTLTRVYPDADRRTGKTAFGLTQAAFDTLVLAVERGYFGVPRGVTLKELGDELGISQQAASERVRRATDQILRTVLLGPRANGRSNDVSPGGP